MDRAGGVSRSATTTIAGHPVARKAIGICTALLLVVLFFLMAQPRTRLTLLLRPREASALQVAAARRWQRPSDYARTLIAAALARSVVKAAKPPPSESNGK